MRSCEAAYMHLVTQGEWDRRVSSLFTIMETCRLCPRHCGVNRKEGELGICRAGAHLRISSFGPHFGEEAPLVGPGVARRGRPGGSGTIFLTHCHLGCVYCQNYEISHLGEGEESSPERTAEIMLYLQKIGCHNINLVSPTHFAPLLVDALGLAAAGGLHLPLVWNCSGYENVEAIRLLEGIVDIYMPDIKYSDPVPANLYSHAPDYWERCREAVLEMHRQVGDLEIDEYGIARRGLLVRHLVLPSGQAGSETILHFIAEEVSPQTYVNIMPQYRPAGRAEGFARINRPLLGEEFDRVVSHARRLGLTRGLSGR